MTKYKGYFIDNVTFNSKEAIDRFLMNQAIESYKKACRYFAEHCTMEASIYCNEKADYLHMEFSLSYGEIEQIEISTYAA